MAGYKTRILFLYFCFLSLASINNVAAVMEDQPLGTSVSSLLRSRADLNLTLTTNATIIVQDLDFTANCSIAVEWHDNLPVNGAGSGSDPTNVALLRMALPEQYQNETDDEIAKFYNEMSSGALSMTGWFVTAYNTIQIGCISPQIQRELKLADLDATENCTATARFLGRLGWMAGPQVYVFDKNNDHSWEEFLQAAMPLAVQSTISDLELFSYRSFFLATETPENITKFLADGYEACRANICELHGYTGNPDIGGIGVISSYTVEASLVTLYFAAINFQIIMKSRKKSDKIPERFLAALGQASEGLLDSALFFSLAISSAGWVSFVSGQSYYEKLAFTSANVLALSALFAFLGLFTREGRRKRGDFILVLMLLGILTESAIQYIVYISEPNERYDDYACLNIQFQGHGYYPTVFEALFFLLLGLSVIASVVALIRARYYRTGRSDGRTASTLSEANLERRRGIIDVWVTRTRIFIQTIAIAVMWTELVYLWKIRTIMSQIAGDTWLEGEWGFGQILALFVWLPPIIDILGWLVLKKKWLGVKDPKLHHPYKFSEKGLTILAEDLEGDLKTKGRAPVTSRSNEIEDA